MRHTVTSVILLGFVTLLLTTLPLSTPSPASLPEPTEVAYDHREDEAFKEARKDFIENMHRAAPGTDWRAIEAKNSRIKARSKFRQIARLNSTRALASELDTLANGRIVGRWRELGSANQAGRTMVAEFDPQTEIVYLAADGGQIWKGPLDGSSWTSLNDHYKILDINFMRRVAIPGGHRLMVTSSAWNTVPFQYSDDNGLTWKTPNSGLENPESFGYIKRAVMLPDANQTIYVLAYERSGGANASAIYRSTDMGETFTLVERYPHGMQFGDMSRFDLWSDRFSESEVFLLEGDNLRKLNPATDQFQVIGTVGFRTFNDMMLIGRKTATQTILYAISERTSASDFYQSVDGGTSFSFKGQALTGAFRTTSPSCSIKNPDEVFLGQLDLFRSVNGGTTWNFINRWFEYYGDPRNKLHADIPSVQPFLKADGTEFHLIQTDGGTYISNNSLATVENISLKGLHISQYYSTYTNPTYKTVHAGSQDQGYQITPEEDITIKDFEQLISGDYGHIASGDNGRSIWMNYPGFTHYYPNASNESGRGRWDWLGDGYLWLAPLAVLPGDGRTAYQAGGNPDGGPGAYLIEMKGGVGTIQASKQSYDFSEGTGASISAIAISPVDTRFRFVMNDNGGFFMSGDGGSTWNKRTISVLSPGSHFFYGQSILPSPNDARRLYVSGSGYSNPAVYMSNDYGTTFNAISNGLPNTLVYDIACTPNEAYLFAATEAGPYVYVAAEQQWYPMETVHAPDQLYWSVEYIADRKTVRFGTYGRGIWDFTFCSGAQDFPVADFTYRAEGASVVFTNQSQNAPFYCWNFGNGDSTNQENPFYTFASQSPTEVMLVAKNGCGTDTSAVTLFDNASSIGGSLSSSGWKVYPNPVVSGVLFLEAPTEVGQATVTLTTLDGKQVYQRVSTFFPNQSLQVPMETLPTGMYVLQVVQQDGKVLSDRVVKR